MAVRRSTSCAACTSCPMSSRLRITVRVNRCVSWASVRSVVTSRFGTARVATALVLRARVYASCGITAAR